MRLKETHYTHYTYYSTLLFIAAISSLFSGCTKDKGEIIITCEPGTVVSYSAEIKPLLDANCNTSGCHINGFAAGDFTTYQGILSKFDNGSLKKRIVDRTMPSGFKMPDDEIRKIVCWVEAGAPEN